MGKVLDVVIASEKELVVSSSVRSEWLKIKTLYSKKSWLWVAPSYALLGSGMVLFWDVTVAGVAAALSTAVLVFGLHVRSKLLKPWKKVGEAYSKALEGFTHNFRIILGAKSRRKLDEFVLKGKPGDTAVISDLFQSSYQFWVDDNNDVHALALKGNFVHKSVKAFLGWDSLPPVQTLRNNLPSTVIQKVDALENDIKVLQDLSYTLTAEQVYVVERAERELLSAVKSLSSLSRTGEVPEQNVADFNTVVSYLSASIAPLVGYVRKNSSDSLKVQMDFMEGKLRDGKLL